MKRKVTSFLLGLLFMIGMIGIEKPASAEPDHWYQTEVTIIYMGGLLYMKSECTNMPGNSCNTPGSIHLIQIPQFLWF